MRTVQRYSSTSFVSVLIGPGIATLLFALMTTMASSVPAQAFSLQVGGGGGGFGNIDSRALTVAATIYFPSAEDAPIRLGFRPALDWHHLDSGEDYFFTGNLQLDITVIDWFVPVLFVGGGGNHFKGSGSFFGFGGSGTGAVFNLGGEVRLFPSENFFISLALPTLAATVLSKGTTTR